MSTPADDAVRALRRIAFLLEVAQEPSYRVRAFRRAAATLAGLPAADVEARAAAGTLRELPGIGEVTESVIHQALEGREPDYVGKLEQRAKERPVPAAGRELRALLRGDCHVHSDWSDGGSPISEMAEAARELGHEYMVLTDHSPRLTVANGLSPERLLEQLDVVAALNEELAPFRILTGIECDINEDGTLDQTEELLERLDVVVGSVHSKLRSDSDAMTARMVTAIANPHMDILGHCTGRIVVGRGRPESTFDSELVFAACREFSTAVEINSRPERLDPPRRLLREAVEAGCWFSVDTDAHAPGQLTWQTNGTARAEECAVPPARVVNTMRAEDLLAWTEVHGPS